MKLLFAKSFGGLTPSYYVRQFLFGSIFMVLILWVAISSHSGVNPGLVFFLVLNTALYPYARFVYESIVGYVVGRNVFYVNALFMLWVKAFTMGMCWSSAVLIAPFGLAYLFWRNSRSASY